MIKKVGPANKRRIRKLIRSAIKAQNQQMLFSCMHCIFYGDGGICLAEYDDRIIHNLVQAHQLPDCFSYDVTHSEFSNILKIFDDLKIDFHNADYGWATVVGKIVRRLNRFGGLYGVSKRNLDRFSG